MRRPLYATRTQAAYARATSHAGLWYDKFCNTWTGDDRQWSMATDRGASNPKRDWIDSVAGEVGRVDLLTEATHRQILLAHARRGRLGVFATESRFITGTGRSHPIENGFVWHPTLGVPYLPSSSIKGMIRRWAEEAGESAAHIIAAFGPDNQVDPATGEDAPDDEVVDGVGDDAAAPLREVTRVIVFDAIPVKPPHVEADVLTPHYAAWTPDAPPGDWRSPVPVPFLVTAAGTELLFSIAPVTRRTRTDAPDLRPELVTEVWSWLTRALAERGAGAKTSVGYGRFAPADKTTERLQQERENQLALARRAANEATPEGRWRNKLDGKAERDVVELVRTQLQREGLTQPAERRALARVVLDGPFAQAWSKGRPGTPGLRNGVLPGATGLKEFYRLLLAAATTKESTP